MGAKSGIKWNGVSVGTQPTLDVIGANVQLILRDPKTQQEWVTTSQDYANFLVDNGIISSGGWGLTGNAGTDYTVNFIGTTDNEPLSFRTNGVARLGFDENGGVLSTTDVYNQTGSYSILQWSENSIDQKIYVSDVLVTNVGISAGSVTTIVENAGTGILNQTIVSEAEILLSATGTGIVDIHIYPNGEIGIAASGNLVINPSGGGNVGIGTATPTSLLTVEDGDIEITNKNNGLIVYSQDGTAWRVSVSDLGVVTATAV
jgi:hypothetical protein